MPQHLEPASLANLFRNHFQPMRAQRGTQLFRRGATSVHSAVLDPLQLQGSVADPDALRDEHDTAFRMRGARVACRCTCLGPQFCEHGFALLLAVDAMHSDHGPRHALRLAGGDDAPEDWQSRLQRVDGDIEFADDAPPITTPGEQVPPLTWVVDLRRTTQHGEFTLLAMEAVTIDGRSALRPRFRGATQPPVQPDDWQTLQLLSLVDDDTDGDGIRHEVPDDALPLLLPLLARSEHLLLAEAVPCDRPPVSLQVDLEPPFRLVTERNETSAAVEVRGVLRRDEQTIPHSQVLAMFGRHALVGNTIVRLDVGRGLPLARTLLLEGPLRARAKNGDAMLQQVMQTAVVDERITSPLPTRHVSGCELVLIARLDRRIGNDIVVDVAFDYEGRIVNYDDANRLLAPDADGVWLARSEERENRLIDEFEGQHGERFGEGSSGEFLLLPHKRALSILTGLVGAGVRVLIDGKPMSPSTGYRISVQTGIDWFDVHGELQFADGSSLPLAQALLAAHRGERLVALGDGRTGLLPEDLLRRWAGMLELGEARDGALRFPRGQALLLDAMLASRDGEQFAADAGFTNFRDRLTQFAGLTPRSEPAGFGGALRDYQRDGLAWLHFLRDLGLGGCLADDMGLGKTVQVLALLLDVHRQGAGDGKGDGKGAGRPSLLVAPRSLIDNWRREAGRFAPTLRVLDFAQPDRWERAGAAAIAEHDLVLTTYGTLRSDITRFEQDELTFEYAILDEAQAIGNAASLTAKSARLVRARHRLALTGTPVQNHLGELWALFEFLTPGLLGKSKTFKNLVGKATAKAKGGGAPKLDVELLRRALAPFLLRRTKEQVLAELPAKQEQTIHCELPPGQRQAYDALRNHYRDVLLNGTEPIGNKERFMVLEALLRLRQAACHPTLVDKIQKDRPSAKLDTLLPMLQEITASGHKALVFSQFTEFLAILRKRLDTLAMQHAYLDGKTSKRQTCVDRFQNDPHCRVFLISLKAGGFGLNLTAADYVFLLDPWWNPAAEAQAIDRAHRMGQTQKVVAYRLVAQDTVEEKVLQLQDEKRALFDAVLGGDSSLLASMTREDLAMILT